MPLNVWFRFRHVGIGAGKSRLWDHILHPLVLYQRQMSTFFNELFPRRAIREIKEARVWPDSVRESFQRDGLSVTVDEVDSKYGLFIRRCDARDGIHETVGKVTEEPPDAK